MIDAVPSPVFVTDRDNRWILANEAMCCLLELPRAALIGHAVADVHPCEGPWAAAHPHLSDGAMDEGGMLTG